MSDAKMTIYPGSLNAGIAVLMFSGFLQLWVLGHFMQITFPAWSIVVLSFPLWSLYILTIAKAPPPISPHLFRLFLLSHMCWYAMITVFNEVTYFSLYMATHAELRSCILLQILLLIGFLGYIPLVRTYLALNHLKSSEKAVWEGYTRTGEIYEWHVVRQPPDCKGVHENVTSVDSKAGRKNCG